MEETKNAYEIFIGKPEGKRPHGRTGHRWENIGMDLREMGWEGMDWMHLAEGQGTALGSCEHDMNLWVP
jgi:hypothetical protein